MSSPQRQLRLVDSSEEWKERFETENQKLTDAFSPLKIEFHHIGSTSIPKCKAKPVLDIMGVTANILEVDAFNEALKKIGYEALGEFGMRQRRHFKAHDPLCVNLHIFEDSDPHVARHLRFRDYLKMHPQKAREYSSLKEALIKRDSKSIDLYTTGKSKFVKEIDHAAVLQDLGTYWTKPLGPRKKTWTQDEIQNAMEVNMSLHVLYFTHYMFELNWVMAPTDAVIVLSSIDDDTFNLVFDTRFTEENQKERISFIRTLYKEKQRPFSWWVSERDTPSSLSSSLLDAGFKKKEEDLGMFLLLDEVDFTDHKWQLSFKRVLQKEELKHFANVMVAIGGYEKVFDEYFSKIPPVLYGEGAPYELFVGYLETVPVVTGILVLHGHAAGIYYVMTDPHYRERGFGTEMMLFLITRSKSKGYYLSTLQASEAGKSLYVRLSYKPLCRYVEYALP